MSPGPPFDQGAPGRVWLSRPSAATVAVFPPRVRARQSNAQQRDAAPALSSAGKGRAKGPPPLPWTSPRPSLSSVRVLGGLSGQLSAGMGSPTSQQMGAGDVSVGVQAPLGFLEAPLLFAFFPPTVYPSGSAEWAAVLWEEASTLVRKRAVEVFTPLHRGLWSSLLCPQGLGGLEAGLGLWPSTAP